VLGLHDATGLNVFMLPEPARKRLRIDDDPGKYLQGDFGTIAPSEAAKLSLVIKNQNKPDERMANDRPERDTDHLPIALLYHGFGRFLDVSKGTSTDHTLPINRRTFEEKVDEFVVSMNKYYLKEEARNKKAVELLNDIFQCVLEGCWPLTRATVFQGRHSHGHALGPMRTIEVILEVKNELAGTAADPIIELATYYTQALKKDPITGLLGRFSFPALGIVVVGQYRRTNYLICDLITYVYIGSHIGFYALAFKKRTRLVALTPLLPVTAESGNDQVRPALLNAFEAACLLRHHIHRDAEEFKSTHKRESLPIQPNLPYITEVATYSPSGGASTSTICFQIHAEAFQGRDTRYPNRFLYAATLDNLDNSNKSEVIVKFTRRYFPELHSFCASQGHAPQLLGYDTIPGGWLVVVMERIEQQDTNLQCYAHEHLQTWSNDLLSLVSEFHNKGWVHGDLRDANLIVGSENPRQVMLVDFDWGGRDGQVYYPTALVHEELEKPGGGDLCITKEHDDYVLGHTLNKLAM
jgi:hypothetical protein